MVKKANGNSNKVRVIMKMAHPKNINEVQSLNVRVTAFNKFVSKVTNKCLPFFKILRKAFEWTDECQKAFEELKAYLASLPLLSPSKPSEELSLYLAISPTAVNSLLSGRKAEGSYLSTTQAKCSGEPKGDISQWRSWPLH